MTFENVTGDIGDSDFKDGLSEVDSDSGGILHIGLLLHESELVLRNSDAVLAHYDAELTAGGVHFITAADGPSAIDEAGSFARPAAERQGVMRKEVK